MTTALACIDERLSAAAGQWHTELPPRYECAFCGLRLPTRVGHREHQREHTTGTSVYRPVLRYWIPVAEIAAFCAESKRGRA